MNSQPQAEIVSPLKLPTDSGRGSKFRASTTVSEFLRENGSNDPSAAYGFELHESGKQRRSRKLIVPNSRSKTARSLSPKAKDRVPFPERRLLGSSNEESKLDSEGEDEEPVLLMMRSSSRQKVLEDGPGRGKEGSDIPFGRYNDVTNEAPKPLKFERSATTGSAVHLVVPKQVESLSQVAPQWKDPIKVAEDGKGKDSSEVHIRRSNTTDLTKKAPKPPKFERSATTGSSTPLVPKQRLSQVASQWKQASTAVGGRQVRTHTNSPRLKRSTDRKQQRQAARSTRGFAEMSIPEDEKASDERLNSEMEETAKPRFKRSATTGSTPVSRPGRSLSPRPPSGRRVVSDGSRSPRPFRLRRAVTTSPTRLHPDYSKRKAMSNAKKPNSNSPERRSGSRSQEARSARAISNSPARRPDRVGRGISDGKLPARSLSPRPNESKRATSDQTNNSSKTKLPDYSCLGSRLETVRSLSPKRVTFATDGGDANTMQLTGLQAQGWLTMGTKGTGSVSPPALSVQLPLVGAKTA